MIIKRLGIEDVEFFLDLRLKLFYELQEIDKNDDIENLINSTKEYYLKNIDKSLITYRIFEENKIVSIGSLCLFERIPYMENISGREGYILKFILYQNIERKAMESR